MTDECFADEIAIDFPSVGPAVERMRAAFLGERTEADVLHADVSLSPREAMNGGVVSIEVPVRGTCSECGGRGESWTEPCVVCRGTGASWFQHPVRVPLPPRVADGACLRFRLRSPDSSPVRVELRVAVRDVAR